MKIFLSAVSSQFKACRDALRSDLSAIGAEILVQEDFQQHGGSLLEKLERYIASCDRVITLIGDAYGWEPDESVRQAGRPRRSYSQWEYFFAQGERLDGSRQTSKDLYVYFATLKFIAAHGVHQDTEALDLQRNFAADVRRSGKDWNEFSSLDELRALILRDGFRLEEHNPQLRNPLRRLPPLSYVRDFTGRKKEIAVLEQALGGDGGRALITAIGGMGGIGKTTLALHVMHRLMDRYPDGQIVVDLKGTTEPLSSAAAMGRVIVALDPERKLPDDTEALARLYHNLLDGRRLLILFDNAADDSQVGELLPASPCAAIVTSRRVVVLPGVVQRVPLDVMTPAEASELLLRIIIDERRTSAAERVLLAERCGYLPLALRAAGKFLARYVDWSVAKYLTALADERERLQQLRMLNNDPLLDVATVLGLSLQQLKRDQPEMVERWRMLAVFAGSFDREAAAAVWAVTSDSDEALKGLSMLLERSMLLFDTVKQRYRLHDLMRDLALGAIEPLSEEEKHHLQEARRLRTEHYLTQARRWSERTLAKDVLTPAALEWYDSERNNLLSAVKEADKLEWWPQVVEAVILLRPYLEYRDDHEDGEQLFALAAKAIGASNNPVVELPTLVWWLVHRAARLEELNRYAEAKEIYQQVLALLHQHRPDDHATLAWVHTYYGDWWLYQERPVEALTEYERALESARATGDQQQVAWILVHASDADCEAGALNRAMDRLDEAMKVYKSDDLHGGEAWTSVHYGIVFRLAGRFIEAEQALGTALAYYEREGVNHVQNITWVLMHMGELYRQWQKPTAAISAYQRVRTIADHQLHNHRLAERATKALAELGDA